MRYCYLLLVSLLLSTAGIAKEISIRGQATDQHGEVFTLEDLARGVYVVDFAASWCEPCYVVLPKLEKLAKKHPGAHFVVISVDDTLAGRNRLVEDLKLQLPVLWDQEHRIVEEFSPDGFPATYVLDQGQVIHHHTGSDSSSWQAFSAALEKTPARQRPQVIAPEQTRQSP